MTANPQFQAPNPADVRPFFGDVVEKTAAQTKDNLERMGAAAGEATNQMKDRLFDDLQGCPGVQRQGS